MAGFYGRFIDRFSRIVESLHALKRKNVKFVWGDVLQSAFQLIKEVSATPPVLQIPNFSKKFTLNCDASDVVISAVLHQKSGEGLAPIAYARRLLSPAKRKYSIYEKECLAVVYGCEKYRSYLEHLAVASCERVRPNWTMDLASCAVKFRVTHISGKANVVADCLTWQYEEPEQEPCFPVYYSDSYPKPFTPSKNIKGKIPSTGLSIRRLSKEIVM
jgi:hypothetical protein